MHRRRFLDATFLQGTLEGSLHSPGCDRLLGCAQAISHTIGRRKKPDRMTMGHPVATQHSQNGLWQGYVAVFASLSMTNVDRPPFSIDIFDPQVRGFSNP